MDNEFDDNAGDVNSISAEVATENNPVAADDFIQSEDFPWEGIEEKEELRTSDPSAIEEPEQEEARIEEAATSGQEEVEKSEEEKQLDEEIKKLQAENPTGLARHLRNVSAGALRGKREAEARVVELEQALEARDSVLFKPSLPAEEFVAQNKPKEFWDKLAEDNPAYYEPMVRDVLRTHLDPVRMASSPEYVEGIMPVLTDIFAQLWFPNFIQETFGVDVKGFEGLLAQHQSGQFNTPNFSTPNQSLPGAQVTPQAIAEKFGIDAETDPELFGFISQSVASQNRMGQLEKALQTLQANAGNGTKQQEEAETNLRLSTFDSMITADINNLLETGLKALPRDASGQVKKEFAHLPKKIERLVKVALDETTNYTSARDHAKKWFKQPGNVETAKSLAGGDLKKIYGTHQTVITQIIKEELAPYVDRLRTQSQFEQSQRTRQQPKGGVSPDMAPPRTQNNSGRPTDLRTRAQQNLQATRQGA
jgi:hypothetical protein